MFPHLITAADIGKLVKIDDVDYSKVDAIFCCLPHATTQEVGGGTHVHTSMRGHTRTHVSISLNAGM